MKKIPTGIPGLDQLLNGGLPQGRNILVSGNCGTGKTLLASQFINKGFSLKEKSVFVTLEQNKDMLIEDVGSIGINFKEMMRKNKLAVIGGPVGEIKFFQLKTKATPRDIAKEIIEVVEEMKATRVVIDSVNLFNMLFDSESDKRHAMAFLTSALGSLNCTSLLIAEVPEESQKLSWHGFEDFVVDGVININRTICESQLFRTINVIKMRGTSHIGGLREMKISSKGVEVFPFKVPTKNPIF